MQTIVEAITPTRAAAYLEHNHNNRPLNRARVKNFVSIFRGGRHRLTHQGIAFYEDGSLADGQHRLAALVEAGVTCSFLVTRGIPLQSVHAIDCGRVRSAADTLRFTGATATNSSIAAARVMLMEYLRQREFEGGQRVTQDIDAVAAFHSHVHEAIEFATPSSKKKGLNHSSYLAAIASAWFTQDRDKLSRFAAIVATGTDATHAEQAAIRVRDFLLTSHTVGGGLTERQDLFYRCCNALRYFIGGRPMPRLASSVSATFPIPRCEEIDSIVGI